jgi:hypothetical protein
MEEVERRFHQGDHIRIREDVDPMFYHGLSTLYNEGKVSRVDTDKFDLPVIYVTWDKTHWSYNGAPDCWTFEDHFDKVDIMPSQEPSKQDQINALLAQAAQLMQESDPVVSETPKPKLKPTAKMDKNDRQRRAQELLARLKAIDEEVPLEQEQVQQVQQVQQGQERAPEIVGQDESEQEEADRRDAIDAAMSKLVDSEAFVIVAVERHDDARAAKGILVPYAMTFSVDPSAELLAFAQLTAIASKAHQELVIQAIAALNDDTDGSDGSFA